MGMWNIKYPYVNDEILNLDWIIEHFNEFIEAIDSLQDWRTEHEVQYRQLYEFYQEMTSGHFPESVYNEMARWLQENANSLIGQLVHNVFFGLTDDGYFTAYIPENWGDIIFGTSGYDTIVPDLEYGHLLLSY